MPDLHVVQGGKRVSTDPEEIRTFDHRAEAEVLGNILVDPNAIDEVRGNLQPEDFDSEAHRRIYEAALEVRDAGDPVSLVTVLMRLKANGRIGQVGGSPVVTQIAAGTAALIPRHLQVCARTVRDLAVRRTLRDDGRLITSRCENDSAGIEQIIADARARIDALAVLVTSSERSSEAGPVVDRTLAELAQAAKADGRGVRPTGFDRLDRLLAGLHDELLIVGARPGMGKTALATGIATNVASTGLGVYIASLETTETTLMTRMVCAHAGLEIHRARVGALTPPEWTRFEASAAAIAAMPLWIDDSSALTVSELWTRCRRVQLALARQGKKLGVLVVDYVQLLRAPRAGMKREEVVGENARALKAMSQELGVTVLALAQLNREVDKRTDRRPQLSDLRESGELEQCARTVVALYREDYYKRGDRKHQPTRVVEVAVLKQNNGPTGMVRLRFDETFTRFANLPEGETPSIPLCRGCGQRRPVSEGHCSACGQLASSEGA